MVFYENTIKLCKTIIKSNFVLKIIFNSTKRIKLIIDGNLGVFMVFYKAPL